MTDPTAMTDAPAAEPAAAAPAAAPAADAAAAEPVKPSGKSPFEIKKWNPVFMWSWDVESDTCSICRGNLNELCLECQTKPTGSDCTIAWGVCNVCHNSSFFPFFFVFGFFTTFDLFFFFFCSPKQHAFHFHCISQWLKQRKNCPLGLSSFSFTFISLFSRISIQTTLNGSTRRCPSEAHACSPSPFLPFSILLSQNPSHVALNLFCCSFLTD